MSEGAGDTGPTGPTLTLKGAARATGVARSTLQRKLREGQIPGAERDAAGNWKIPIAGLIAAGHAPSVSPPDTPAESPAGDELERLRADNVRLRAERDAAVRGESVYRQANEQLLQALSTLQALMPAPAAPTAPAEQTPAPTEPVPDTRGRLRRWWANL